MTIFNLPRHERTPETEIDILLTNLSILYNERLPDRCPYEFINTWFKDFYENELTDGDDLASVNEVLNQTNSSGIGKASALVAILISCAYCVQALKAYDNGELNEAWTYVIDARFWCGIPMSRHSGIDILKQAEHKEVVSKIRRESRSRATEKYDFSEFILGEYNRGPWDSKTQAAKVISEKLNDHIEANDLPVKKYRYISESGEIIERQQHDFYNLVLSKLPSKEQFKVDQGKFKKPE